MKLGQLDWFVANKELFVLGSLVKQQSDKTLGLLGQQYIGQLNVVVPVLYNWSIYEMF